jgi:VanZ family protein
VNPVLRPELRYRRLWFVVGLILAGIIAYVCLVPGKDLPEVHLWDKLEHWLAFVALALWFGCVVVRRDIVWLALGLLAFGGLIELLQSWMSLGREGDIKDLVADALGIATGLLLAVSPLGRLAPWLERKLFGARA